MGRLEADFTPGFKRDYKRVSRARHGNMTPLHEVFELILENSPESLAVLRQRHNMHRLRGVWSDSNECHVCNAGDWLLIWKTSDRVAAFQRTGTHDELFR